MSSAGDFILPSHLFSKVEEDGDSILLSRLRPDVDLAAFTGAGDAGVIMGRCRILQNYTNTDYTSQSAISPSDPFLVIGPSEQDGTAKIIDPADGYGKCAVRWHLLLLLRQEAQHQKSTGKLAI